MLAYKDLGEEDYEEWAGRRLQASLAQDSREDRLASVYEEMENDMMVRDGPRLGRAGRARAWGSCLRYSSCWAPRPSRTSFSKGFRRPSPS